MTDASSATLLQWFGECRAALDGIERRLEEQARAFGNLERDQTTIVATLVQMNVGAQARLLAFNGISARLERIERRLELTH